ncbi:tetratricopeptide repeat protein [Desulfovibrio gilichinskyi]|uniref:Tetratricopeptide repeat-containing protein n=1 Tax=Desulfovibrio gilichinskyi TaxID=1519643 RepID=A0A1X7E0S5_9BACT|nr:tetratricopeptide repeat protein [Desulfovibrio gilichinskyi]SMF25359.1 Tetratricopeptide repeat-containing protein [Desulfovibrio gilichinskyi]
MFKKFRLKYHERMALNGFVKSEFETALKHFKKIAAIAPDKKGTDFNTAVCLISLRRYEDAEKFLQKELEHGSPSLPLLQALAENSFLCGNRKKALSYYEKILKENLPEKTRRFTELKKKIMENETAFKEALKSRDYMDKGDTLLEQGDYVNARKNFTKATKLDPTCFQAHNNLGVIAMNHFNDYKLALTHFEKADELNDIPAVQMNIHKLNEAILKEQNNADD